MEAKTENFNISQQNVSKVAKLLAHPSRVKILEYIASQNTCITGDLFSEIPLSRATIHQHLKVLKEAGWIKGSIFGSKICYCVDFDVINNDTDFLLELLNKWKTSSNSC